MGFIWGRRRFMNTVSFNVTYFYAYGNSHWQQFISVRELLAAAAGLRGTGDLSSEDPFCLCCRAQLAGHGYLDVAGVNESGSYLHRRAHEWSLRPDVFGMGGYKIWRGGGMFGLTLETEGRLDMWCPEVLVTVNWRTRREQKMLRERRMGCLDRRHCWTFILNSWRTRSACLLYGVFVVTVLYCSCYCFHTPDELLCLQMSAPCKLPDGDEVKNAGGKRYFSPLLLIDVDPVQMQTLAYGVSYCKVQPTNFSPLGHSFPWESWRIIIYVLHEFFRTSWVHSITSKLWETSLSHRRVTSFLITNLTVALWNGWC